MDFIITARVPDKTEEYRDIKEQGITVCCEYKDGAGSSEKPHRWSVRVRNENTEQWRGIISIELELVGKDARFFLPSFMYGRNRGDCPQCVPNEYPRMRDGQLNRPSSPYWMVRGDRLSHPCAFAYANGTVYGISAPPYFVTDDGEKQPYIPGCKKQFYQYGGFSCSLENGRIGYTLGYENAPWLFVSSHNVKEREGNSKTCFELNSGEEISFELFTYEYSAENEMGIHTAVRNAYYAFHEPPREGAELTKAVKDLSCAISDYAWLEDEKMYTCFVFEDKKSGKYTYNKLGSFSWTNGLSVAVPMLMASRRLGNEKMKLQAKAFINNAVKNSLNEKSGLPYDAVENNKWSVYGWWFDGMYTKGHSAYIVGQGIYYLLKAYILEKESSDCGEWLDFAAGVIARLETTKNRLGEYPYIISEENGCGAEYDSMAGAWCMTAALLWTKITGDMRYIEDIKKSERYYYDKFVSRAECYGGPLDVSKAVDNEGILAYIRAVRILHELTGEEEYLRRMYDALCYEFTFKFCYNSPVQVPPLSKNGWSSCGGSVTSTANPHIHPMSSSIVDEMLYYYKQTGDEYVYSRMRDTIMWGEQTYNQEDNEYDFGKKGWMSERFCYSQGLLDERYPDGSPSSTWFALMAWASASVIEGMAGDYYDYSKKYLNKLIC